jgi:hypothetical protein
VSANKLTDEQRRARTLAIDQISIKIKEEYGDALSLLGALPIIERVRDYTPEEHVEFARQRGIELDVNALRIQRDYLALLGSASVGELNVVTRTLNVLLVFDQLVRKPGGNGYMDLVNEIIHMLTFAETMGELKRELLVADVAVSRDDDLD